MRRGIGSSPLMASPRISAWRRVTLAVTLGLLSTLCWAPQARGAEASWEFEPASWDFGTVVPGDGPTPPKAFTLTNTGDVELSVFFVAVGGNEGAGFSIAANKCGKLTPSASCTIEVTFDPSSAGPKDGALSVSSQGGEAPQATAELSGTGAGPEISMTPGSHSFPALPLGDVSPSRSFTLTNTGSLDLTISWLSFVLYLHGDTDQFRITGGTCAAGLVVLPQGTCTVEATFAPTRPGYLAADLLIGSNASGLPHVATVEGFGIAPPTPQFPVLPRVASPRASIVHRPKKQTRSRSAAFWFRGSPTAARFACKLDSEPFRICQSPAHYDGLDHGRHRFTIRALAAEGYWGPPKVFSWRVR